MSTTQPRDKPIWKTKKWRKRRKACELDLHRSGLRGRWLKAVLSQVEAVAKLKYQAGSILGAIHGALNHRS